MRVLGLDIGTASVGWAVIDEADGDESGSLVALGSRVFPAGAAIKGSSMVTKAAERRQKRAMRRQHRRRSHRKALLRAALAGKGLAPDDPAGLEAWLQLDVEGLWSIDADGGELTLQEVGRLVYWLSTRRGFLSLRSGGGAEADEDEGESFVPKRLRSDQESALLGLWAQQAEHHPSVLTDELLFGSLGRQVYPVKPEALNHDGAHPPTPFEVVERFGVHGIVFFQRAIYWRESTVGHCPLMQRHTRAPRGDRAAQDYALRLTLINLRVGDDRRPLTQDEVDRLTDRLRWAKTMTFKALRRELGLDADAFVSLDRGRKDGKLLGHQTDATLGMPSALGEVYRDLTDEDKDRVVQLLMSSAPEQVRIPQLRALGLDDVGIDAALNAAAKRWPTGRAAYSRAAMRRLLPYMVAGSTEARARTRAFGKTTHERSVAEPTSPLVKTAVAEALRVTRAVERDYGPIDVVRVETARDVRQNAARRRETETRQRDFEAERARAAKWLEENDHPVNRSNIERVRLWRAQGEVCLYSGRPISAGQLFTACEVDHIAPRSLSLDNSFANKAVVFTQENRDKGGRTVGEWLSGQPDKMLEIQQRAKSMRLSFRTRQKLGEWAPNQDDQAAALLAQTGYITTWVQGRLRTVLPEARIEPTNGRLTAQARHLIGLSKPERDYRRHALDAAMVAITDAALARRLRALYRSKENHRSSDAVTVEPWEGFRGDVLKALEDVVVSHRVNRRVRGSLHEETLYGEVTSPERRDKKGQPVAVAARRRPVEMLNAKQVSEVADPAVRKALYDHLSDRGIDLTSKTLFKADDPPLMPPDSNGDRIPIRRVRTHISVGSGVPLSQSRNRTLVVPGNNVLAAVYRLESGSLSISVASLWRVCTSGHPSPPNHATELLFTLAPGDVFQTVDDGGVPEYWRVTDLDGANRRLGATLHWVDGREKGARQVFTAKRLKDACASKVVVSPSGLVRTARD